MKAEVNGITLAYGDRGNGLPLVLVHGFPLCRKMWRPQIEALAKAGCRVITPDLRGFGESGLASGTVSMATYADDIVALMDHLGIDKAVVGGMSMGGYVLLNLLERYPDRVAAPVFIVTKAGADDDAGKARRTALGEAGPIMSPMNMPDALLLRQFFVILRNIRRKDIDKAGFAVCHSTPSSLSQKEKNRNGTPLPPCMPGPICASPPCRS